MDTLLVQGDHYRDARGLPVALEGAQELLQRALIRLQVRKGSFLLDRTLGSELHKLPRGGDERTNRLATGYVQEALADMPELSVQSVTCTPSALDELSVQVELRADGETYLLEVGIA